MSKYDMKFKNGVVTFDSDYFLWNGYGKDDLDQEDELTEEQWLQFVEEWGTAFAENVSDSAHDAFFQFCKEHKLGDFRDEE